MKRTLTQKLGLLGVLSFLSYAAAVVLCMMLVGAIGMKLVPAQAFGVVERFSVFAATGFNAALGIHLFCGKEEAVSASSPMSSSRPAGVRGPVTDIQIVSEQMQKTKARLNRLLARHTGRTPEKIAADTERDKFLSAPQALAYGLIDRILVRRESE